MGTHSQVGLYLFERHQLSGCDTYSNFCDVQNPYNITNDKGVAGYDETHIFSTSIVYEVPFGKGQKWSAGNGFLDYLIGGWQINGILALSSGTPYDIQAPYQISNTNNISGAERADVVGNPYANTTPLNPINVRPSRFLRLIPSETWDEIASAPIGTETWISPYFGRSPFTKP